MIRWLSDFFKRKYHEFLINGKGPLLWGGTSGILVGTSWIPFPPWALAIALTPLFVFCWNERENLKKVFWAGWWCQFFLTLIGFHWVAHVSREFGYMPWPVSILVLLLFASLMHIYIPLAFVSAILVQRKNQLSQGATIICGALALSLFEQLWPAIFKWNFAYPLLWSRSHYAQLADVFGFSGLSFFIILLNGFFAYAYLTRSTRKWATSLALVAVSLIGGYFWGAQKKTQWEKTDAVVNTLLVQANIGNTERIYAEKGKGYQGFILNEFIGLTREGLTQFPNTDLIVWPESAFPDFLNEFARTRTYPQQLFSFLQEIKKPLLTGAYSKDPPEMAVRDDYNGVFLFDDQQRHIDPPYHKTHLLIFGEYIPFGRDIPWLAKVNPGGIGWGRGNGPQVWNLPRADQPPLKLGPQVCYESLYPEFSRNLSLKGADLIVNVTNDSWFGPSFEPQQHLFMTLARGLEVRRPVIRSTNTGISSVMLADGTVLEQSPLFKKWVGLYPVKYRANAPQTFYAKYGDFFYPILFSVWLFLNIWFRFKRP
jgi:apolipoprotein N-acyltransferase